MDVKIETSDLPPGFKYKESTKFIEDLTEDDKGQWVEMTDDELKNQMSGLMNYMCDKEIENVDWDSFNFKPYDSGYYEEKYPCFDENVYKILAGSTKDENKVVDTRSPPLKFSHEETTLKFDR